MKVMKTEEMITTESSKENVHTDVQMLMLHDTSPPDTGASRNVAPLPCTISPISLATAGSIVLVSINNDPGFTELQKLYVLFVTVTDISKFSLSMKQSPNIPKQTPEESLMFLRGWGLQNKKS